MFIWMMVPLMARSFCSPRLANARGLETVEDNPYLIERVWLARANGVIVTPEREDGVMGLFVIGHADWSVAGRVCLERRDMSNLMR